MGWFDKKSWQLKRKIKDLQADLRDAERDGKYVLEQGLFFAELEDMGDMTMMVFGTADHLASQEESVIRGFFDRNGFTVAALKLDKARTGLAEVEIIPPEELTRHVGRALKASGYRMIDDTEKERPADLQQKVYPLSALIRGISILFSEQVQQVIATTRVKMNKEGNRLLHWMPKIIDALEKKVPSEVVDEARNAFLDGYQQHYGRLANLAEVSPSAGSSPSARSRGETTAIDGNEQTAKITPVSFGGKTPVAPTPVPTPEPRLRAPTPQPPPPRTSTPTPAADIRPVPPPAPRPAQTSAPFAPAAPVGRVEPVPTKAKLVFKPQLNADPHEIARARDAALAMARMYRSLIGAQPSRCVRNAEVLLEEINAYFEATSTCLMVKVPQGDGYTIHSNAGKRLSWGQGGGEGFPVSSSVLTNCLRKRAAVASQSSAGGGDPTASMIMHSIESAAAAPVLADQDIIAILYVDRRDNLEAFTDDDCDCMEQFARIFQEFPELLMGR